MRISDGSSDVFSADLETSRRPREGGGRWQPCATPIAAPAFAGATGQESTPKRTLSRRQAQPHEQPAHILALFQCDIAAVNLRDVAHARQTEAGPRLADIEPHAPNDPPVAVGPPPAGPRPPH